jgi:subtilisin family serine protease
MDGAAYGSATGTLVDGGLCAAAGSWAGAVVLCQRGDISFAEKVAAVEAGGGVAAAIYNNVSGNFSGTLGEDPSDIPAVSLSQEDGLAIVASALGTSATVSLEFVENSYAYYSGTSMSAPHVSGAAAVLFSSDPSLTPAQVREALTATALDLGDAGLDDAYGHGLIQLYDAWQYLGAGSSALRPPLAAARALAADR